MGHLANTISVLDSEAGEKRDSELCLDELSEDVLVKDVLLRGGDGPVLLQSNYC